MSAFVITTLLGPLFATVLVAQQVLTAQSVLEVHSAGAATYVFEHETDV